MGQQDQIRFDATSADRALIKAVVARAKALGFVDRRRYTATTCRMDITATHLNGCPLRLADLLASDNFNFAHDIAGIAACLDRGTGRLTKNFSPRFSDRQAQAKAA